LFLFFLINECYLHRDVIEHFLHLFIEIRQFSEADSILLGGEDDLVVVIHLYRMDQFPDRLYVFLFKRVVIGKKFRVEVVGDKLYLIYKRLGLCYAGH